MTKSEMVKRSASEQAQPLQGRARSTAEAQMQLIARLDQLAEDQTRLTEEQRTAARQLAAGLKSMSAQAVEGITKAQKEVEMILTRSTATLIRTEESVQTAEKAAKSAATQAVKASKMIEAQASRLRWTVTLAAGACGLLIGMALLLGLLIWQPVLIQKLWQMAQAIR